MPPGMKIIAQSPVRIAATGVEGIVNHADAENDQYSVSAKTGTGPGAITPNLRKADLIVERIRIRLLR